MRRREDRIVCDVDGSSCDLIASSDESPCGNALYRVCGDLQSDALKGSDENTDGDTPSADVVHGCLGSRVGRVVVVFDAADGGARDLEASVAKLDQEASPILTVGKRGDEVVSCLETSVEKVRDVAVHVARRESERRNEKVELLWGGGFSHSTRL